MPRLINLSSSEATEMTTMRNITNLNQPNISKTIHQDEIEFNLSFLKESFPGKILFSLKEAAEILCVSYEFVRNAANSRKINFTANGERKFLHINTLSKLITTGIQ